MDLIRDVLDNQLVDRRQRRLGKIDGIIMEIRGEGPPLLKAIESGWPTKAWRLHPRLGRLLSRWSKPYRIPWKKIRDIGVDVEVDLNASETPLLDLENRLRAWVRKIPGG
jgi:sporulation protein YlmC with PRC-barrel domain